MSSMTCYSTHRQKNCNLFVLYHKNSNGDLEDLWGMKKKNVADVDLMSSVHVSSNTVDHSQQSMKMHI